MAGRSRKDTGIRTGHRTKEWKREHVHVEGVLEEGMPIMPSDPALIGNHKLMKIWKRTAERLLALHLLAKSDGDALVAYAKAELAGQHDIARAIAQATWGSRKPFVAAVSQLRVETVQDFIESVRRERDSFLNRRIPDQTVTLDADLQPYGWDEMDSAAIAKRYASDVLNGAIVSGALLKLTCRRFMSDLETGASRGLWFDVVAARHIVKFAEIFCQLKLLPWEVFILSNIFGWKKPSGYRRFKEVWVSCAKKNGKTGLAAVVGLWGLVCDLAENPDIFSAATKKEQARLVFRDAIRMVSRNKELREFVQRWTHALSVNGMDNASFSPLSSDTKSMDGLRPYYVIADEVAFWANGDQWDKLQKGMVIYEQPVMLAISTAGDTRESFVYGMFEVAERILRTFENSKQSVDHIFVCIYAVDPKDDTMNDEACWYKANPSLGVIVLLDAVRQERDKVLQNPAHMTKWLQLQCNIWPDLAAGRPGSISEDKWNACAGLELIGDGKLSPRDAYREFLKANMDTVCYGGLDIGLVSDLSCVVILFPKGRLKKDGEMVNKRFLIAQGFMPEMGLIDKERAWGVPLTHWVREGWIELVPGDMVDPRVVKKWITDFCSKFMMWELGYDPYNSRVIGAELLEAGVVKTMEVTQMPKDLTAPAQELLTAINRKDIVHFGNPYLAWNARNVILAEDERRGGIMPDKNSPKQKIDAIQATLDAWHRMLAGPDENVYSNRGINFI